MLGKNEARSLFTGKVIPRDYYMREFGSENFVTLLSISDVRSAIGKRLPSARVFANIVLVTENERAVANRLRPETLLRYAHGRLGRDLGAVLESQLLPASSLEMFKARDYEGFLNARADLLYSAANVLTAS
jgi:hypothetical protein